MRAAAAKPLHEILETDWDATLFRGPKALANQLGWTSYHTLRSKGSKTGYPDRTLVRDRIVFAELKRELTGKLSEDRNRQPSPDQVAWLDKLASAGGEVYLWRPSDLDEIGQILAKTWTYHGLWSRDVGARQLSSASRAPWRPKSLWIPGVGRSDTTEQQSLLTKGAA